MVAARSKGAHKADQRPDGSEKALYRQGIINPRAICKGAFTILTAPESGGYVCIQTSLE
jgi:hypothetical protein